MAVIKVGDAIPDVNFQEGFPPEKVNLPELCKGKRVVLVGLPGVLGNRRCQRFSMLIDNGNVKSLNVSASAEDPAGDADPSASLAEKMVEDVQKIAFAADTN